MKVDESGVYLDDIKLQDIGIQVLLDSDEPFLSGINRSTIRIPNRHGAHNYGAWLEPIDFTLNCLYQSSSFFDMKEMAGNLKQLLLTPTGHPKPVKLRFDDAPDRYYLVEINSDIPTSKRDLNVYFPISFTAFDPVAFSLATNAEISWGSEDITFYDNVYTLGHAGDGAKTFTEAGSTVVTVAGDTLRPILYLNGTGTNVALSWNGQTMTFGSFVDSVWVIDLHEYTILKDDTLALGAVGGPWMNMEMEKGTTEVTVDGTGLDVSLSFKFHDRFY